MGEGVCTKMCQSGLERQPQLELKNWSTNVGYDGADTLKQEVRIHTCKMLRICNEPRRNKCERTVIALASNSNRFTKLVVSDGKLPLNLFHEIACDCQASSGHLRTCIF